MDRIKRDELLELHRKVGVLVFPSIWEEQLPYAVVEASLSGIIPVASKVGGVIEIVTGSLAERFLFKPGNFKELVSKINDLSSGGEDFLENISEDLRKNVLTRFNKENTNSISRIFMK